MVEPDEETVERLQMRNKWIEEDYDPTLFSNRGTGRMVLVGYRRRKAINITPCKLKGIKIKIHPHI